MYDLSLQQLLLRFTALLIVVAVHGLATATAAYVLGDEGVKHDGRVTLNPLSHLDLIGALGMLFFLLGWIKPIEVDPRELRRPHLTLVLIALAGIGATLALAFSLPFLRPLLAAILGSTSSYPAVALVNTVIDLSIWFAIVNLIPIPPLTGSFLLLAAFPDWQRQLARCRTYGRILIALLIVTGLAGMALGPMFQVLATAAGVR